MSGLLIWSRLASKMSCQWLALPKKRLAIFDRLSPATTVYVCVSAGAVETTPDFTLLKSGFAGAGAVVVAPLCTLEKSGLPGSLAMLFSCLSHERPLMMPDESVTPVERNLHRRG